MLISIVIVNWNSKDYLRKCLRSIETHASDLDYEAIVVDGASYDGCAAMLAEEFPYATFVQSEENIGFGRCNNLGVQHAKGELLLLLNPDTEIKAGSIHALLEARAGLPENAMLGARLLNTDGSLQTTSVHAAPTPLNQVLGSDFLMKQFPRSKLWGTYEAYHSETPTSVEAISGACMFLPTALFRQFGGFNPVYFMYAEDMDLCFKLRQSGLTIYHIPAARITHHGGSSSMQQVSQFSTIQMKVSLFTYFTFSHSPNQSYFYLFLLTLVSIFKLLASPLHLIPIPGNKNKLTTTFLKNAYILKWLSQFTVSNIPYHSPKDQTTDNSIPSICV